MKARIGRRPYWIPRTCAQLRQALREMGATKINGQPLSRVRKAQLLAVYISMREKRLEERHD